VFAGLGQPSLHGVVPRDEEVWEIEPAHLGDSALPDTFGSNFSPTN
jgi:hypothetical protein